MKKLLTIILSVIAGILIHRFAFNTNVRVAPTDSPAAEETKDTVWTCSMHPQIKLPKKGKCPICFMDLIPLDTHHESGGERVISISDSAAKLMQIETSEVIRNTFESEVRLAGTIDYDETRIVDVSARVAGRLDRLYINYAGMPIQKGDQMAEIYSPDLLTAQEELFQAIKSADSLSTSTPAPSEAAQRILRAAREKLLLLGLDEAQVNEIAETKSVREHITIHAPVSGIVIERSAQEGVYVQTGAKILTIADLSQLWVKLDAYESDLEWMRPGGTVDFTTEAYPGKIFTGTISFIDPIVNAGTRTAKVRVVVQNEDAILKPGMFVRAIARVQPTNDAETGEAPLIIPMSAALRTGKRAIVYRQLSDESQPTYEGRVVTLGDRIGDHYIVASGLEEGDRVVTRGAFMLDAELQIQAKPSMMSEHGEDHEAAPLTSAHSGISIERSSVPLAFQDQLSHLVSAYFELQEALAADSSDQASQAVEKITATLSAVDSATLEASLQKIWIDHLIGLNAALKSLRGKNSIEDLRHGFLPLSNQLIKTMQLFPAAQVKVYQAFCPMAFDDQGGAWLQKDEVINNPYFGDMMLRCGEIQDQLNIP